MLTREGLDDLFRRLWALLDVIRVYSKEPGKPTDLHKPFILTTGVTVVELPRQVHRDLSERMKFARACEGTADSKASRCIRLPLRDRDGVDIHE
jgi:ribosome-interacting GTPase 1